MDVKYFTQSNGKPCGVFVIGHFDPELVIHQLNRQIIKAGFIEVSEDYVAQVYAARVNGIQGQPYFNTHVFDKEGEGSTVITWIDGNLLEEAHPKEENALH